MLFEDDDLIIHLLYFYFLHCITFIHLLLIRRLEEVWRDDHSVLPHPTGLCPGPRKLSPRAVRFSFSSISYLLQNGISLRMWYIIGRSCT